MYPLLITLLSLVVLIIVLSYRYVRSITIFSYQRGLKYDRGKFTGVLLPGRYYYLTFQTAFRVVDDRIQMLRMPVQEIVTADGIQIRVTATCEYKMKDPEKACHTTTSYEASLYNHLQVVIREIVSAKTVDELMRERFSFSSIILEKSRDYALEIGLILLKANIKDVILPGQVKDLFSQVVQARQEGLAALERARGESAALRNLANAAKLLQDHPHLLELRMLQSIGESQGNTFVFGVPLQMTQIKDIQPPKA